jgi:hypothetical protein
MQKEATTALIESNQLKTKISALTPRKLIRNYWRTSAK